MTTTRPAVRRKTTSVRRDYLVYTMGLGMIILAVGLTVGYMFGTQSKAGGGQTNAVIPDARYSSADPAGTLPAHDNSRYPVTVDDDPAVGPIDAPITIIEFGDFECPFCKLFHDEVYPALMAAYPNQIRFVFRDYAITAVHPHAQSAAEAANCAHEQGKFWEFHDALYARQGELGAALYGELSSALGLNQTKFVECLNLGRYANEVRKDYGDAVYLGIRGTPTFFINGRPLVGAQRLEAFQALINEELGR
jgi:protein-disulfide isomerase